jgi:hypothetical protein
MRSSVDRTQMAILIYGLLSAIFYSSLLPLWEGFDELYHYGYVQSVWTIGTFPMAGKTSLSRELWTSLDYVAVSPYIQPHLYRPSTNFTEYFRLSDADRRARRRSLDSIPQALRRETSPRDNYEVKQAPITYLLLAPADRLLAAWPLPARVLALRLLLSCAAIVLLWAGTRGLARRLGLLGAAQAACLFVIFSCQMLYGTACHVANDALILPWLVFFLNAAIDSCESPALSRVAWIAGGLAIGVLIKASLLVFIPLAFAAPLVFLVRRRLRLAQAAGMIAVSAGLFTALAGPWYLRNLVFYGNLTATPDVTGEVGMKELLGAAATLPWRESIATMAHQALWTGNNSFTSFSAATLNLVLALLALAGGMYCARVRRRAAEVITMVSIALYIAGIAFITLSFFYSSRGAVSAAVPWYMTVLLAPVVALCCLGLARWRNWGRWIAVVTVLLWAYVAAATWVAKLVPLYGGFEDAHARPRQLLAWYLHNSGQRDSILASLCPAPLALMYVLFAAVLAALLIAAAAVLASLFRTPASGFAPHEIP